jgi:hypothetical protein
VGATEVKDMETGFNRNEESPNLSQNQRGSHLLRNKCRKEKRNRKHAERRENKRGMHLSLRSKASSRVALGKKFKNTLRIRDLN